MNRTEAAAQWAAHKADLSARGVVLPDVTSYMPQEFRTNFSLAMDAQPQLATTASSGFPQWMTAYVDPDVLTVLFAPCKAAEIFGETQKGAWETSTAHFPVAEQTGQSTAYGDFDEGGVIGVNTSFEVRENFAFQVYKEIGQRETAIAGAAKIDLVAQKDRAAVGVLKRDENLVYFYGVGGLQNYGLLNDPSIASNGTLTPVTKAAGGTLWANATANEVVADVVTLWNKLQVQTSGSVEETDELVLAHPPGVSGSLSNPNEFGLSARKMLKDAFPKIRFVSAVQYSSTAGNLIQLIAPTILGEATGYCAYSAKLFAHDVERKSTSFRQKMSGAAYGAIVRYAAGVSQMLGI
jgi:hypothetical protein